MAAPLGPANQHVQSAFSTLGSQRSKAHGYVAAGVLAIAHTDENHIALVALHVFQVLAEERLGGVVRNKGLNGRFLPAKQFELVPYGFLLLD